MPPLSEGAQRRALQAALVHLLKADVEIQPRASRIILDEETAMRIHRMVSGGGHIYDHSFSPATDSGAIIRTGGGMCAECPRMKYSHMVTHS